MDAPDLGPSVALGDLNGDGKLEIVVCAVKNPFPSTKLLVYDSNATILFTKTLELNSQSSPILADLDGDGGIDIVHGGEAGILHAWNFAGNELNGFPIPLGDYVRGTPAYCDLNMDGRGDLVLAGWDGRAYVWMMTGQYRPDRAPWPTFHGNMQRTGFIPRQFPTATESEALARRLSALWSPNPFNPSVTLRFAVPGTGGVQPVRVEIYDPRGRHVRTLVDDKRAPGRYQVVWDGRNAAGVPLGSGIYFYRVRAGHEALSGKLTLLR
jgi:hypothetical protein